MYGGHYRRLLAAIYLPTLKFETASATRFSVRSLSSFLGFGLYWTFPLIWLDRSDLIRTSTSPHSFGYLSYRRGLAPYTYLFSLLASLFLLTIYASVKLVQPSMYL